MGLRDAAEQLEVCKAESVHDERRIAELQQKLAAVLEHAIFPTEDFLVLSRDRAGKQESLNVDLFTDTDGEQLVVMTQAVFEQIASTLGWRLGLPPVEDETGS